VTRQGNMWVIAASIAFKFQDLCTRCKVSSVIMNAPTELPKAFIPHFKSSASTDPILMDAVQSKPAPDKKQYLDVTWDGRHHSTFDKDIWSILEAAKGKPVMLETKANGKYSNVLRILRVDGVDFAAEETGATEDGLPFYR
jgi:hypothetical protein